MVITFNWISLRNFLSYGNNTTKIILNVPGTTLVVGENLDDTTNGIGSNGTGKSTIVNCITYALFDKPISDISKDNLVNNINKKNMEVFFDFNVDDDHYLINRNRKSKNGNNVFLYKNDVDITLDSVANTNALIEQILGISYDLFVRIVVFFASHRPFLDSTKSEQTAIFEQLVGLTMLSDKASTLKETIKETEFSLQLAKSKISVVENEHQRYAQQLKNAKDRMDNWVITNEQDITNLQEKLDKLNGVDLDKQQSLHEELSLIDSQLTKEISLLEKIENKIESYKTTIKKETKELLHLQDNKCPFCLQLYTDTTQKIEDLQLHISEVEDNIKSSTQEVIRLDKIINEMEEARIEIAAQLTTPNIRELLKIKSQSDGIEAKIEALSSATNPHTDSYNELKNVELDEVDYDEINTMTTLIEHQKILLKLLTKKDSFVRKTLLNNYIPYLNSRLQYYLKELGLPHSVEFTHEMTAKISQFGRSLDFGNLSAGQKARVNLSLSMAFSDMLQRIHTKINICILDEVLDLGLDAIGTRSAAKLLKKKAMEDNLALYIISHKHEIESSFDNVMTIQMSKGFSYIKEPIST